MFHINISFHLIDFSKIPIDRYSFIKKQCFKLIDYFIYPLLISSGNSVSLQPESNHHIMSAIDILRGKGLKKSAQRIAIINILQDKQIPLTESDIKLEMGDMYDRITFYRTIQVLLENNIIHRITIDNVTVKYALNNAQNHSHIHFFCKTCHSVTCLKDIPLQEYALPENYEQEECEVLIKGICNECKSRKR